MIERKTNRLHHKVCRGVKSVCVSSFHPQALGLLGLVATILGSSPTATHSLSLGVTTHTHTHSHHSCCCVFLPALHCLHRLTGPFFFFFFQDLILTTSNAYTCTIQIRQSTTKKGGEYLDGCAWAAARTSLF